MSQNRYVEAESVYKRAVAAKEKEGPRAIFMNSLLTGYSACLRKLERTQEAEALEARAKNA